MRKFLLWVMTIALIFDLFIYNDEVIDSWKTNFFGINENQFVASIPIVKTTLPPVQDQSLPIAKRDLSVYYYLQSSVRISYKSSIESNTSSVGSGTICYYDAKTNEAFIVSCGHLFAHNRKNLNPTSPKSEGKVFIDVFYKNQIHLNTPQTYPAEIVCFNYDEDISLIKFTPDWIPDRWFPFAFENYVVHKGDIYESVGCDAASEPAAYTVTIIDGVGDAQNLISQNNSPRPGRSGGGLCSGDGYFLGIVWGTTKLDGTGYGFYVPMHRIRKYFDQFPETAWLNKATENWHLITLILIVDKSGKIKHLPDKYIPLP